ncbi:metallophosphoesterase family protein [Rubellimicrobium aerolatum]|uniref:Exonuclease SbcCD subunit D n=1 Tax=Rubellimicrobium aerolatum TaxID=490979 RepID=A0ABW0SHC8_9RHOB|nr:DNA repair exonuclease [Rubellimicrobium aerolatum]MBP1807441.1 DNA repair exonuclease SbcCD nuclease subunit [Rubellimicrobium aerolatum]
MRFIHAADLHLDSPLAGLRDRSGDRAERLVGATRRAFEGLVDHAIRERIDFVLIAGDVFDGNWADHGSGLFLVRQLSRLAGAGIPVAMIRGNHDAESVIARRLTWPANVHEFPSRSASTWEVPGHGAAVHGQSFATRKVPENLAAAYPAARPGLFNIGLLHTSATGHAGHDTYAPCDLQDLLARGYDYWALGHVHGRELLCEDPPVLFPGNLQGRHVNEPGAKGFTVVTVEGGRVRHLEEVHVDVVRWTRLEVDASSADTIGDLCRPVSAALREAVRAAEGRTLAVRLVLTGASPAHRALAGDPVRLEDECHSVAIQAGEDVWIEGIEVRTRPPSAAPGLGEGFSDLLRLLREVQDDPAERADLLRVLEGGLAKVPPPARAEGGLDGIGADRLDRLLAEAEALLLHHLASEDAPA